MKHCRPQSSKPCNVEEMSYVGDLSTQPGRRHVKTIPSRSFNEHDYILRRSNSSGTVRTFTERFDNFTTIKYT